MSSYWHEKKKFSFINNKIVAKLKLQKTPNKPTFITIAYDIWITSKSICKNLKSLQEKQWIVTECFGRLFCNWITTNVHD